MGGGLLSLSLSLSLLALFGTLKFLNALFLGFCALFVILSLCKKATQRVARRKPQQKKSTKIKRKFAILGYFACAQYDKIYDTKSVWYDKFGLLLKNNGYFHSNFEAKIQIFHSKFKTFYKSNSFHKFYSKFKPYTRLFHIFTPSFCSVQTDKKFFTRRTLCLNRNL